MTRWARAGNTQKHKKMPGDATKWGEFDHQKAKKDTFLKSDTDSEQSKKTQCRISKFPKSGTSGSAENYEQLQHSNKVDLPDSSKNTSGEQTLVSSKKNKTNKGLKNSLSNDKQAVTPDKMFEKKKEMYLKKLQIKRNQKGILLLPSKVERKLYLIKKRLREKGVPPSVLKEIMRKERRREELKFRKDFNPSKLCFNCRQPGHFLADCPKETGLSKQETGMCFKCGSEDHTSFKCPKKIQGFPFAKCFICEEQGHISKDCPKNKHGVYPKGGKCNLCGNVNHLKKDCPSLYKKDAGESAITLHTINEGTSIDEEVMDEKKTKKRSIKNPKVVKF